MQNPPTTFPPPLPHSSDQIPIFPIPSPPSPFASSPSSVFQINVNPGPPQPPPPSPFAGLHTSVDLSPLQFLLAIIAIITIPALIYTFVFAFWCPSSRRRRQSSGQSSSNPSVSSELPHHDVENSGEVTDVKYQKEARVKEIGGECPVCLSVFADGEEVRQLSVCKHSFHASCIDMWLSSHTNCPICRANIASATKPSGSNSSAAPNGDGDPQHGGDASA
ncbi:hypothetical protein Lal_00032609 [Lupinus albus]|uniref:Putative transcription factor C2H2 family n=1 Tax=Lupinus albus TaxID=3870 RepID=A0A6A4RB96_LUPAL|nr:putative transcription factor C2H2 family [Lupinus albus]KAF1897848.1 hypothetical protein Lal_00032609 [Lupinus albus]